ncbi:hypothetical protein ACWEO2_43560 [Nocardia sp. NPDC004278]
MSDGVQYAVAEFLAEIAHVAAAGLADPQTEHGQEREARRVVRIAGRAQQRLEPQVRKSQRR